MVQEGDRVERVGLLDGRDRSNIEALQVDTAPLLPALGRLTFMHESRPGCGEDCAMSCAQGLAHTEHPSARLGLKGWTQACVPTR